MISIAHAQEVATTAAGAAGPQPGGVMSFLPFIGILLFFYFLVLRPNHRRTKEHAAMLEALQKGAEVVTQGGLAGRIAKIGEQYLLLEIANGVEVAVQRSAVQMELPKGTLKSLS
ncbi:MAG: preprotein translocase subunit YajC [Zoogloeaceae bacterium]|jgi:preprotein translocase subunit YajC|nr:preprotein translocase subunit YajC [Zoogloeaceae bacterium]